MKYYSLNNTSDSAPTVSFKEAVIAGLAPDKGLYFPRHIPKLPEEMVNNLNQYDLHHIARTAIQPFVGNDIPEEVLQEIVEQTLNFDTPLVKVTKDLWSLELYHGPTMAFKDIGARFMARCLGYFNAAKKEEKVRVLVATSGDTGGAVANGFLGVPGVEVIILYPEGMVSPIQEKQLTTLGQNIRAFRVKGTFDDCQRMVKTAFTDKDLQHLSLTSANSINIARWLPQMFYYFAAVRQLQKEHPGEKITMAVPSGNFGNICAGMMAAKMGLPISHFVAATNINDTVPRFLEDGKYTPLPAKATISNAMDVSDPSNFIRITRLFGEQPKDLEPWFSAFSFSDTQTREAMKLLYKEHQYLADPHGAVGYLGAMTGKAENFAGQTIFLETAHPVKFKEEVEDTLGITVAIPPQIGELMHRDSRFTPLRTYEELQAFLLE